VQLEFGEGCEELYSEPLVDWLSSQGLGRVAADSQDLTTSCYRGYVVRWVIHSDHLWLDRISNWGEGWIVATPKARIEGDEYVRIENAEEFERRQAALQFTKAVFQTWIVPTRAFRPRCEESNSGGVVLRRAQHPAR
jgi:hypothetical protein